MTYEKKYVKYYDLFNSGKNYTQEVKFLEEIFKRYSKNSMKKILDLGCGTGLHEKELTEKGYEITGLDLSEEMIDIAKERHPRSNFVVGDMSNFKLDEKFDAIICMFSAMGYLTENEQIKGFFKSIKEHLKEDGLLIIDCWNGLGVMNELPTSREKTVDVGGLKIVRRSFPNLDSKNHINNVKFKVKVSKEGTLLEEYEEDHKVRFFFPKELEKYMDDEGFQLIHRCPSFEIDKELDEKAWNMILIGKLKAST